MNWLEIVIVIILVVWGILNTLYVIFNKTLARYTYRFDVFKWISAYQLFSGKSKYFKLSFRDVMIDNSLSEWNTVPLLLEYKWYHFIWFPKGLIKRDILSAVDDFVSFSYLKPNMSKQKVSERFIYQTIFNYVCRFKINENTIERQFRIEEMSGISENYIFKEIFISDFHKKQVSL